MKHDETKTNSMFLFIKLEQIELFNIQFWRRWLINYIGGFEKVETSCLISIFWYLLILLRGGLINDEI